MRIKTLFIIAFTALVTVFLVINTDAVEFNFIFTTAEVSKLVVIGVCTFIGFVLGYIVAKPITTVTTYDDRFDANDQNKDHLSEEDRKYIS
jgi:putative membrane protein